MKVIAFCNASQHPAKSYFRISNSDKAMFLRGSKFPAGIQAEKEQVVALVVTFEWSVPRLIFVKLPIPFFYPVSLPKNNREFRKTQNIVLLAIGLPNHQCPVSDE